MQVRLKNTTGHHIAPSVHFRYTFDDEELRLALQDQETLAVVHHGELQSSNRFAIVHSHLEDLTIYSSAASGIDHVTSGDLAAVLSGKIRNWQNVGGKNLPIQIGVRVDGISPQCSRAILKRHGLRLSPHFYAAHSYKELAAFACREPGAITVGLRGRDAQTPLLTELRIEAPVSIKVSLLLRIGDPLARHWAEGFAESLVANGRADGLESEATLLASKLINRFEGIEPTQHKINQSAA